MAMPTIFVFSPILKVKMWGGEGLRRLFPDYSPPEKALLGEAWLFGDLSEGATTVATGLHKGKTPRELAREFGQELTGPQIDEFLTNGFPLLFKLIDAKKRLSLQVHPNDQKAQELEEEPRGKSEAWYVLEAEPGARLFLGTKTDEPAAELLPKLESKEGEEKLGRVAALPGHVYPVSASTLHAIGEGILLAEIQQSSNTTYRVHDWGRLGLDGKPRPLHLEKAIKCTETGPWKEPPERFPSWSDDGGLFELMALSDYFLFERITLHGRVELPTEEAGFSLLLPLTDGVTLVHEQEVHHLPPFQAVLVPACWRQICLSPTKEHSIVLRAAPLTKEESYGKWRGLSAAEANKARF